MTSRQGESFRRVPIPTVPNLAFRLPGQIPQSLEIPIPLNWAFDSLVPFPADLAFGF